MKNERKPYVVKRLRLYIYLKQKGWNELYERPDMNNTRFKVWIFESNEKMYKDIEEFYKIGY